MRATQPPREPTVGLTADPGGLIEVVLPPRVTAAELNSALADATRLTRLSRPPARILLDGRFCERFDDGVVEQVRAWLREIDAERLRLAVVLSGAMHRVAARALLLGLRRGRGHVAENRPQALRWLREG